jgi:hypothetical protein
MKCKPTAKRLGGLLSAALFGLLALGMAWDGPPAAAARAVTQTEPQTAAPRPPQSVAHSVLHVTQAELLDAVPIVDEIASTVHVASLEGTWRTVALPYRFLAENTEDPVAVGEPVMVTRWFRTRLPDLEPDTAAVQLYLPRWQAVGHIAVYGDGHLLHHTGGNPVVNHTRHPAIQLVLAGPGRPFAPRELLIRLDSYAHTPGGLSSFYVGDSATLSQRESLRYWFEIKLAEIGSGAFSILGLLCGVMWLRYRSERLYLLVAAYSAVLLLRQWISLPNLPLPQFLDEQTVSSISIASRAWHAVLFHFFLVSLHGRVQPWVDRGFIAFGVGVTAAMVALVAVEIDIARLNIPFLWLLIACNGMVFALGLWHGLHQRSFAALVLATVFLLCMGLGVYDMLKLSMVLDIEWPFLFPHTVTLLAATLMYLLLRRGSTRSEIT